MKKLMSLLLVLVLCLGLLPAVALAEEDPFVIEDGVLVRYNGIPTPEIVVPDGVREIASGAFSQDKNRITSVLLPKGLEVIRESVFSNTTALESITMPDSLRELGDDCFSGSGLKRIELNEGLERIGKRCFRNCRSLEEIVLPDSLTDMGSDSTFQGCVSLRSADLGGARILCFDAFLGCAALTELILPEELEGVYLSAVDGCTQLPDVPIPLSVSWVNTVGKRDRSPLVEPFPDFVIRNYELREYKGTDSFIEIPAGVRVIKSFGSGSITGVSIPDTVTEIGDGAFYGSKLTRVEIPGSVARIGQNAFSNCRQLKEVRFSEGLREIDWRGFAFDPKLETVELPEGLKIIGVEAFTDCKKLRSVTIPDSVESVGGSAFSGCPLLEPPEITEDMQPDDAFEIDEGVLLSYNGPGGRVRVPDGVTAIADYAFMHKQLLTEVVIPDGVTSVGAGVFYGCPNLRSAVVPGSVRELGKSVFWECPALVSVTLGEGVPELTELMFYKCSALEKIDIPGSVKKIGLMAFDSCTALRSVTLHEGLEELVGSFGSCTALQTIQLPSTVRRIDGSFGGCTALEQIGIPDGVEFLGHGTFAKTQLRAFTFPSALKEVEGWPLYGCGKLEKIVFPTNRSLFGGHNFQYWQDLLQDYPHLDELVNNPSPTLKAHVNTLRSVMDAWENVCVAAEPTSERVQTLSDEICAGCQTETEKLHAVCDWVIHNLEYDYDYYYAGLKTYSQVPFTPEEVLDSGLAVCAGYARLTQALLAAQGIPALYVVGPAGSQWRAHAWNLVRVDGRWTWVDNTWGEDYVDVGTVYIALEHVAWSASYFAEDGTRFEIAATLSSDDYAELEGAIRSAVGQYPEPDPEPAEPGVESFQASGGRAELRLQLGSVSPNRLNVLVACYDARGRFLGNVTATLTATGEAGVYRAVADVAAIRGAASYRAFIVTKDGWQPVMEDAAAAA